jgi:uncharacterized protein YndB with AHSA1/START domain
VLTVSASRVLAAGPERVWELIGDTRRYAEWVVGTDAVTRTDGPADSGSTYDEANTILGPWKARTAWRVVEFDPPRRQVHASGDVPLSRRFEVVMELAPEGAGTRFTLTLRAAPSRVGTVLGRLMRASVARNNRRTVANLARLVEASS